MRSVLTSLAVVAVAITLEGCHPMACNDMYVPEGLRLVLEPPKGIELQSASGRLVVDGAPQEFRCAPRVHDGGCDLWESTLFLPLDLSSKPRTVEVQVTLNEDNALAFGGSVRPRYTDTEPNGRGCGYVTAGEVTIALAAN